MRTLRSGRIVAAAKAAAKDGDKAVAKPPRVREGATEARRGKRSTTSVVTPRQDSPPPKTKNNAVQGTSGQGQTSQGTGDAHDTSARSDEVGKKSATVATVATGNEKGPTKQDKKRAPSEEDKERALSTEDKEEAEQSDRGYDKEPAEEEPDSGKGREVADEAGEEVASGDKSEAADGEPEEEEEFGKEPAEKKRDVERQPSSINRAKGSGAKGRSVGSGKEAGAGKNTPCEYCIFCCLRLFYVLQCI